MSTNAPKPPSKKLLLATGIAGGFTASAWSTIVLGITMFHSIPANRQVLYILLGLATFAVTAGLATTYIVQRHRRNAWWDSRAARDELSPDDDAPLRKIRAELEKLTEAVFDLADVAARPREPQVWAPRVVSTYVSRAAQGDTVPMVRQTVDADTDVRTKVVDAEAEARAQGYAEGYVDGIARRQEGTTTN